MIEPTLLNGDNILSLFKTAGYDIESEDKDSFTIVCGNADILVGPDSLFITQETVSSTFEWLLILDEIKSLYVTRKQITVTLYCGNIFIFSVNDEHGGD